MANATTTIAGDIQLAGDLAGNNNAASPALTNTGVTAGSYTAANVTVNSKGQITSASDVTAVQLNAVIGDATTTTKGVVQVGDNISVIGGVISVPLAVGSTTFGVVKAGTNVTITGGVVSVDLSPYVNANTTNTFTAAQRVTPVVLTYNVGLVEANLTLSNIFTHTLTNASNTVSATNLTGTGLFTFIFTQDATGSRTISWSPEFVFPGGSAIAPSTAANSTTIYTGVLYNNKLYMNGTGGF